VNRKLWSQYPLLYIFPVLIIYFVFSLYPMLSGFYYAFTDWNIYKPNIKFVGLDNFKFIFQNGSDLLVALKHTLYFAFGTTLLQNVLAFLLALLIDRKLTLTKIGRIILFLPCILSPLLISYVFTAILHPDGLFNVLIKWVHLQPKGWLGDPKTALNAVVGINLWQWTGFSMAIYLAGLQGLPQELLESSKVEGANFRQQIYHIILPLIAPAATVNIILCTIGSMKVFELVYILTYGGPGNSTEVFTTYIYKQMADGRFGYGVAANIILFIIVLIIAVILLPILRRREVEM
jgi:raffinose/stachyose/melibiose transport system permease protein